MRSSGQVFFGDDAQADHLLPLTYTMPPEELRVGILTLAQKWALLWNRRALALTVNARLLPSDALLNAASKLRDGQGLRTEEGPLLRLHALSAENAGVMEAEETEWLPWDGDVSMLRFPEDIFLKNGQEIRSDVERMQSAGGEWALPTYDERGSVDPHTVIYNSKHVWIHPTARVSAAVLDASDGPIWVGAHAEIMPGALVKGPMALGEHATLKMGAKIYGDTTVGPYCKVGGEVSNSILHSYSNKGHDGFMGNSVIGRWCNWGADTNNSNLKNNYESVKLWDIASSRFRNTGLTFCGLVMADHAKCGINTMFNTGTVIGVGANVFGGGFVRPFVPCFAWGGIQGMETFRLDKFCETADKVMQRRGMTLSDEEKKKLQVVFEQSAQQRTWEKGSTPA
jgi:UDP-N-acetylglucosamine diphosphorylase/glucosamine-1-phosphate N-acetyltransferase